MQSINFFEMGYSAIGGLGVFFLGLRGLTESLQTITGELIQKIINYATSNRIMAVLVGICITCFVQSSSITTVMVVGLSNAGLMSLKQSIGVILGANIGTTITGWILAIKVGKYGLLFISIGIFPMLFAKNEKVSATGKVCVALGLIFFGLELMSSAFKPLRTNEAFIGYLEYFDTSSIGGLLGSVFVGCILTLIIQSSSAMLGITIALAVTGSLSFGTAAALVLGENIGTTITALLASIGTSRMARRAAFSHALFNVVGVCVMLIFFQPYIALIDSIVPGSPEILDSQGGKPHIAEHIAMGHSLFNICATLLVLPFVGTFVRLIEWILPVRDDEKRVRLQYIGKPGEFNIDVALDMARKEMSEMSLQVSGMMEETAKYIRLEQHDAAQWSLVEKAEEDTDLIAEEITKFVCRAQEGKLSTEQTALAYSTIRGADELESIADYCLSLCHYCRRARRNKQQLSDAGWDSLFNLYSRSYQFFQEVAANLDECDETRRDRILGLAAGFEKLIAQSYDEHLERLGSGDCDALAGLSFSDMSKVMRRVKNHSKNLFETIGYDLNYPVGGRAQG